MRRENVYNKKRTDIFEIIRRIFMEKRPVVLVVMDGVGVSDNELGNAVKWLINQIWTNFGITARIQY